MKRNTHLSLVLALSLVAVVAFGNVAPARANAPIVVNSTLDEPDDWPGFDGCLTEFTGVCTLRAAIMEANALAGADTIILPASAEPYQLTRAGFDNTAVNGDLDITSVITIVGGGAASTIIDGGDLDRVFHVVSPVTVNISGVTIQQGRGSTPGGGGILNAAGLLTVSDSVIAGNRTTTGGGAGILSNATLTLNNTLVSDNHTPLLDGQGGGLHVWGTATVNNSQISGNSDGGMNGGGGIYNNGTLTLNYTGVTGNTTNSGYGAGGISNYYGTLTLNHSTVSGNQGVGQYAFAGGVVNLQGTLTLNHSTLDNNTNVGYDVTYGAGGGLYNNNEQGGSATLINSTVSGNSSRAWGGGIYNFTGGVLHLRNSTVAFNRANSADTNYSFNYPYGGGIASGGTVYLSNTIIAGNVRGAPQAQSADDCSATLNSEGYNLFGTTFGCNITGVFVGNQTAANPNLGALAFNGGPTQTHALLAGSPAIDGGNPGGCADGLNQSLTTDQRGFARTLDGDGVGGARCDIGAFEFTPAFFQVFVPIVVK